MIFLCASSETFGVIKAENVKAVAAGIGASIFESFF